MLIFHRLFFFPNAWKAPKESDFIDWSR